MVERGDPIGRLVSSGRQQPCSSWSRIRKGAESDRQVCPSDSRTTLRSHDGGGKQRAPAGMQSAELDSAANVCRRRHCEIGSAVAEYHRCHKVPTSMPPVDQ